MLTILKYNWRQYFDFTGIVPVHIDSHQFVMVQRHKEYNDLIHALQIMRIIDVHTTKPQTFLAMWLLQTGKLKYDTNIQVKKFSLVYFDRC